MIIGTFGCQDNPNQKKKNYGDWIVHLRRNDGEGLLRGTVEHKIEQSGGCPPNQETPKSGTLCYHSPLFFKLIYFSWRLMTLQYCSGFCHTLIWVYMCSPS